MSKMNERTKIALMLIVHIGEGASECDRRSKIRQISPFWSASVFSGDKQPIWSGVDDGRSFIKSPTMCGNLLLSFHGHWYPPRSSCRDDVTAAMGLIDNRGHSVTSCTVPEPGHGILYILTFFIFIVCYRVPCFVLHICLTSFSAPRHTRRTWSIRPFKIFGHQYFSFQSFRFDPIPNTRILYNQTEAFNLSSVNVTTSLLIWNILGPLEVKSSNYTCDSLTTLSYGSLEGSCESESKRLFIFMIQAYFIENHRRYASSYHDKWVIRMRSKTLLAVKAAQGLRARDHQMYRLSFPASAVL